MKILRFTGYIGTDYCDIRITTDMINNTDENFNVVQIQEGNEFNINDKKSGNYLKYFSPIIQETNNSIQTVIAFADSNSLNLRVYSADGSSFYLTDNQGISNSNSKTDA